MNVLMNVNYLDEFCKLWESEFSGINFVFSHILENGFNVFLLVFLIIESFIDFQHSFWFGKLYFLSMKPKINLIKIVQVQTTFLLFLIVFIGLFHSFDHIEQYFHSNDLFRMSSGFVEFVNDELSKLKLTFVWVNLLQFLNYLKGLT